MTLENGLNHERQPMGSDPSSKEARIEELEARLIALDREKPDASSDRLLEISREEQRIAKKLDRLQGFEAEGMN